MQQPPGSDRESVATTSDIEDQVFSSFKSITSVFGGAESQSAQASFNGRPITGSTGNNVAAAQQQQHQAAASVVRANNSLAVSDQIAKHFLKSCVEARRNLDAFDHVIWPKMMRDMAVSGSLRSELDDM